ncbi:MAG TPA: hypothetical protein VMX18_00995 [Candidatus Bipolaricaulota bacterium]|nr:hypothetical protein [Candidatus Bipolaricaulota bacterium]
MAKNKTNKAWQEFQKRISELRKKQLETLNKFSQRLADRQIRKIQQEIKREIKLK